MSTLNRAPLLLWNGEQAHSDVLMEKLKRAERFICMVAFAKESGYSTFEKPLQNRIDSGMHATFVIGVDFYQSDPGVLKKLLKLKRRGKVDVYMGAFDGQWTFHPKVYLFENQAGAHTIVGSANMTSGGLINNHELSVSFDSASALREQLEDWVDELLTDGEIVEATAQLVSEYARQHDIYTRQMDLARQRAKRSATRAGGGLETLAAILQEMKADQSEWGFDASVERREIHRREASVILEDIASDRRMDSEEFLEIYEQLISRMHSGGLQRGKTTVAKAHRAFRAGVRSLLKQKERDPAVLFDDLKADFGAVDRAGTNVITEILHLLDNKRFAVMNRNSVAGIRLANVEAFPHMPSKRNVRGDTYALFCDEAANVRRRLGLTDFSELDAVFNYAYWRD
ncbi:phospholipase D family protein [Pseudorhizobium flavum]|uniref:phospholipase D family protein n=1 Tax=Pseudorhizobium flavum TaxID=1335061 RepID=UPI0024903264|nr:phospholipase D family protein [Pseudorhizobium flavum]